MVSVFVRCAVDHVLATWASLLNTQHLGKTADGDWLGQNQDNLSKWSNMSTRSH